MFGFEKSDVWKESMDFTVCIYKFTVTFPKTEMYSLTDQLCRASASISANIAERTSRQGFKDQAHYTTIAYSSLMETLGHLFLALKSEYIKEADFQNLRKQVEKIAYKLISLQKHQQSQTET